MSRAYYNEFEPYSAQWTRNNRLAVRIYENQEHQKVKMKSFEQ